MFENSRDMFNKNIERALTVYVIPMPASLTFKSVDEILCYDHSKNKMKATEQYFLVVLFIMLYKVVLPFESVDEIL